MYPSSSFLFLCILFLNANVIQNSNGSSNEKNNDLVQLEIPQGLLQGKRLSSRQGKEFFGFMGIPFAQAPERFQPAREPAPSWEGVYDATEYKPKCLQFNFTTQTAEGSEDCLFINVFTPSQNGNGNASVLAFIHGGGFQFGLAYENGPEFILDHEIIFVTFTYRLAMLGFLTTNDNVIPGNLGLKDQLLALKWIKNNIQYFGGDKNRVTLFGESAGSASVSLHILSPLSSDLFRFAICQSGSALDRWPLIDNPKQYAVKLAEKLECSTNSSEEILECLQSKPGEDIVNVQLRTSLIESMIMFGPVLEVDDSPESPAFIKESPKVLYEEGRFSRVPLIMTVNDVEGLLVNALAVIGSPELTDAFNNDWDATTETALCIDKESYSNASKRWATQTLREHYFGSQLVGPDTLMNLTNMYTDGTFAHRTRRTALIHGRFAPVFTSLLGFKGIWSQTFAMGFKEIIGMTHADDLSYLFTDHKYPPFQLGSDSENFSKLLVNLWVNFANTGDPGYVLNGQKWLPLSTDEINNETINWLYLKNQPEFVEEPLRERMVLWDQIDTVLESGNIPNTRKYNLRTPVDTTIIICENFHISSMQTRLLVLVSCFVLMIVIIVQSVNSKLKRYDQNDFTQIKYDNF